MRENLTEDKTATTTNGEMDDGDNEGKFCDGDSL